MENNNNKFQNKYRIPSARAVWHDYNGGTYFITVCTKNRQHYFGNIVVETVHVETVHGETVHAPSLQQQQQNQMQLSPIGQFLTETINSTQNHHNYAEIPLFVVMPNHWHAIVHIDTTCGRDGACTVSTTGERWKTNAVNETMQQISLHKKSLSVVIGSIKSAVTKYANENNIDFEWQPRFHEHIIRNQNEMNKIADYITNNIFRWNDDCFNDNTIYRLKKSL